MSDKTIQDLEKQVQDTGMGLHDPKQLAALFGSVGTNAQPAPPQQTPVEPATAPIPPSAPAVPPVEPVPLAPVPPAEPVRIEPNILELLPEKFRDKDAATSIQKITKSYSDIEAELQKQKDELAQMNKLVQSLSQTSPAPHIPAAAAPGIGDDVDDTQVWEKPKESVIKLASKVAAAQILAYHELQERVKYVEAFKQGHPDFDSYKEDMMVILRSRPDLDRDYHNLPAVYEASKARYSQRLTEMKSKMGLETPTPAQPSINMEEIERRAYEKARKAIEDEFAKRQAASGIMGSGTPVSPDVRVTPAPPAKPKSVADQVIEDMLASGPKKFLPEL